MKRKHFISKTFDIHLRSNWTSIKKRYMECTLFNFHLDPFGLRFDNYQVGAANPFAGQIYGNTYQPYSGFGNALGGYQYRGW